MEKIRWKSSYYWGKGNATELNNIVFNILIYQIYIYIYVGMGNKNKVKYYIITVPIL